MPENQYQIVFTADTSAALAGIKHLEQEFRMLESYINGTGSGIGSATSAMNGMAQGCQNLGTALDTATHQTKGFHLSVLEIGKAWAISSVLDAGAMAISTIAESATKARDRIKELAIETLELADKMRELANLKGHDGPDDEIVASTVELGIEAGMLPEEAKKYLEQFEGSSPAGVQKGHIDARTKERLAVEGARFGTKMQLNPETAGDLAGVISQYTDLTKGADGKAIPQGDRVGVAMAQMGRVAYGLNEGRGKLEPLVRSLINTAGEVVADGGSVNDLAELAAIQGVASTHAGPDASGTRVRQASRALRDTKGDAGLFLRSAGIEDKDGHLDRLVKVKRKLDEAKAKGIQGDTFLRDSGFTDDFERRAVLEQANDVDIIQQRIAKGRQIDGAQVSQGVDKFFRFDRAGLHRQQKATRAGQDYLQGRENRDFHMAKETADMEMRKDKGGWGYWAQKIGADLGGVLPALGAMPAEERWKMNRADRSLVDRARKSGIAEEQIWDVLGIKVGSDDHNRLTNKLETNKILRKEGHAEISIDDDLQGIRRWHSDKDRTTEFNRLSTRVERAQGNPNPTPPDIKSDLHQLIHETKETNRILREKRADNVAGPPRPPLPPAIPPARGAAAPKRP